MVGWENEGRLRTERAGPGLAVCIGEVCDLAESEWKLRTGETAGAAGCELGNAHARLPLEQLWSCVGRGQDLTKPYIELGRWGK